MAAKELKVGSLAIPKESRMNPDTSRGLYVNAGVRAQARSIQLLKDKKSEEDKLKRIEITKKNADILRKREEAYTKLTIDINRSVSPIEDVLSTMTTESLKWHTSTWEELSRSFRMDERRHIFLSYATCPKSQRWNDGRRSRRMMHL